MRNTLRDHSGKQPRAGGKGHEHSIDMLTGLQASKAVQVAALLNRRKLIAHVEAFS
jgi:hypothetical protein